MSKTIRFNAFRMNTVSHQSPGLWTHPRDTGHRYTQPGHWLELARLLERGLFDAIFPADVWVGTTYITAASTLPCATACKCP